MTKSSAGGALRWCIIVFLFLVSSCSISRNTRLELALKQAGNNKFELEKVIGHYAKKPRDSLKYRAALFLIENMLDSHQKIADKNPGIGSLCKKIDNIDYAFYSWYEFPWNKELDFGDLCKHVLSCNFGSTSLYGTRKFFINKFKGIEDTLPNAQPWEVSRIILKEIKKSFRHTLPLSRKYRFLKHLSPQQLINAQIGGCYEEAILSWMALRSLGLPAAVYYIPL